MWRFYEKKCEDLVVKVIWFVVKCEHLVMKYDDLVKYFESFLEKCENNVDKCEAFVIKCENLPEFDLVEQGEDLKIWSWNVKTWS